MSRLSAGLSRLPARSLVAMLVVVLGVLAALLVYDEVSSIVFGPEDRVVMLLRGPSGTAIEQRTLP